MPPKSKRSVQLEQARDSKRAKSAAIDESESTTSSEPSTSGACIFEPPDSILSDEDPAVGEVCDERGAMSNYVLEWIASLSKDDRLSLSILLWHLLVGILSFKLTDAAEIIGRVLGRSDRTVREWRVTFNANGGTFPDTL